MDKSMSSRPSQSKKLQDMLKFEEIKNVENIPPASSAKHPKQKEELVKFMSNVPSYLEKGENRKEKALSVGVLDFRRLEKWQSHQKTTSQQSSRCSPSTSNSSSFFSTDESPAQSSRGHSSSPARKRTHGPSLRSHLNSPPKEAYSQGAKTAVTENFGKFEDLKSSSSNPLKGQQDIFRMYQSLSRNQPGIKLKESKWEDTEPKIIPKVSKASPELKSYGTVSRMKGKQKIQDGDSASGLECQEHRCDDHRSSHQRCKTMVFPRDDAECSQSAEKTRRSISEGSFPKEVYNAYSHSGFPHSCPLPCKNDGINDLERKHPSSVDAKSKKSSHVQLQPPPCSLTMSFNTSRGKKMGEKLTRMPRKSTDIKSSEGSSDLNKDTVEASRSRNPSPTRRLINSLGLTGRVSISKDSSENVIPARGSDKTVASSCLVDSGNSKTTGKSRAQSSPLRRLLDPLLRPKASNSHQFVEPSEKDLSSVDRACKSSTVHPVKSKLDFSGCKSVVVDDSHAKKKQGSSTVQALLRIVIKNGLPLFTFAVDSSSDILAASMRKDEKCCIYTFFTVLELKKKNGWINRGCKDTSRGYVPNAVARMAVSDSQVPNLARQNSEDDLPTREFVLSSVDIELEDQHASDLQTNDELAAIVVKVPKGNSYLESGPFIRAQELLSTTVILPSGVHGLPSKGEPSPLINRWKLGGVCDCGGWDLGCRLRVLANQTKHGKRPSSAKIHNAADRFELFSQGEEGGDTPVFSMSFLKDGIFSVEFNSVLSSLQAFSICIAVLSCREPYELLDLSKPFEEKCFENEGIKDANHARVEVLESYGSNPPLSPIGRV